MIGQLAATLWEIMISGNLSANGEKRQLTTIAGMCGLLA
jgi:hypothetical protein